MHQQDKLSDDGIDMKRKIITKLLLKYIPNTHLTTLWQSRNKNGGIPQKFNFRMYIDNAFVKQEYMNLDENVLEEIERAFYQYNELVERQVSNYESTVSCSG